MDTWSLKLTEVDDTIVSAKKVLRRKVDPNGGALTVACAQELVFIVV